MRAETRRSFGEAAPIVALNRALSNVTHTHASFTGEQTRCQLLFGHFEAEEGNCVRRFLT